MKLSELIAAAQAAQTEHGDIDVWIPCPDEGIDDDVYELSRYKVRLAGSPSTPRSRWSDDDDRLVFVVA
jgi:hypothetical protein